MYKVCFHVMFYIVNFYDLVLCHPYVYIRLLHINP